MNALMNIQVRIQSAKAQKEIAALKGEIASLNKQMSVAGKASATMIPTSAFTMLSKWGSKLQWAGRQLVANFTVPLAAVGYMATKVALENEAAMVRVQKVYGDARTGPQQFKEDVNGLSKAFDLLSVKYAVQRKDVANIAADWAAAGATGGALARGVDATLMTMTLGELNAADATQALIAIQAQYGTDTKGLIGIIQTLNATENTTGVTFAGLVEGMSRSASAARSAGVDVDHLAAMIAAISPAAGSAGQAGNALKTIFSRMLGPTGEARDVLGAMGINIDDVGWKSLNGAERLERLADAYMHLQGAGKGMVSSQAGIVSAVVASRWQINRFDVLMRDLAYHIDGNSKTNGYYTKTLGLLSDKAAVAQLAQSELNAVLESNPYAVKRAGIVIQNSLMKVVTRLMPQILWLVNSIAALAKKFSEMDPALQKIIIGFLAFLAVLGPPLVLIGSMAVAIGQIGALMMGVGRGFKKFLGFFKIMGSGAGATEAAVEEAVVTTEASLSTMVGGFQAAAAELTAEIRALTAAIIEAFGTAQSAMASAAAATAGATAASTAAATDAVVTGYMLQIAAAEAAGTAMVVTATTSGAMTGTAWRTAFQASFGTGGWAYLTMNKQIAGATAPLMITAEASGTATGAGWGNGFTTGMKESGWLANLWATIKAFFGRLFTAVVAFGGVIAGAFSKMWAWIIGLFTSGGTASGTAMTAGFAGGVGVGSPVAYAAEEAFIAGTFAIGGPAAAAAGTAVGLSWQAGFAEAFGVGGWAFALVAPAIEAASAPLMIEGAVAGEAVGGGLFAGIAGWFSRLPGLITGFFSDMAFLAKTGAQAMVRSIGVAWRALPGILEEAAVATARVLGNVWRALPSVLEQLAVAAARVLGVVLRELPAVLSRILPWVLRVLGVFAGSVAEVLSGPIGWAITAVITLLWIFRKQIGQVFINLWKQIKDPLQAGWQWVVDLFNKGVELAVKGMQALPNGIKGALQATINLIEKAAHYIYELFSYINPFAHHSPSLVENVTRGLLIVGNQFGLVAKTIEDHMRSAYNSLNSFGKAVSGFMSKYEKSQQASDRGLIKKHAGADAAKEYDGLLAQLTKLQGDLASVSAAIDTQQAIVDTYAASLKDAQTAAAAAQKTMDDLSNTASDLGDQLASAQDKLDKFANMPIQGMREMSNAIFDNEIAQKKLRLEMLKMNDVSLDDLNNQLAGLQGDIENLRGEQSDLRAAGAGADVLSVYQDQIDALAAQGETIKAQAAPLNDLQNQLDALQKTGEMLDLENAINFDPMLRQIDQLANAYQEMPFDDIVSGITSQKQVVNDLQTAYDDATTAVTNQQAALDAANASVDAAQAAYDAQVATLDALQGVYDGLNQQIQDITDSINEVVQAASDMEAALKSAGGGGDNISPALENFLGAAGGSFPDVGDALTIGDETGSIDDWLDEFTQSASDMFSGLDIFAPFKDMWTKFKGWWNSTVVPFFKGIPGWFTGIWNNVKTAFQTGWNTFTTWAGGLWDGITGVFQTGWDTFTGWASSAWGSLKTFAEDHWGGITDAASNIWNDVKTVFTENIDWSEPFDNIIAWFKGDSTLATAARGWWDKFKEPIGEMWTNVQTAWDEGKQKLSDSTSELRDALAGYWDAIKTKFEDLRDKLSDAVQKIKDAWQTLSDKVAEIKQKITDAWDTLKDSIVDAWQKLQDKVDELKQKISDAWQTIKDKFQELWDKLAPKLDELKEKLGALWDRFGPSWEKIQPALKAIATVIGVVVGAIVALIAGVILVVTNILANVIGPIIDIIVGLIDAVIGVLTGIITFITDIFTGDFAGAWQAVLDIFTSIWDGIYAVVKGAIDLVIGIVVGLVQGIVDWFTWLWDILVGHSIIPDLVNAIIDWFKNLWDTVVNFVSNLVSDVVGFFSGLWTSVTTWVSNLVTDVVGFFTALPGRVVTAIGNVTAFLKQKGTDFLNGLKNGITEKWEDVKAWVGNLAGNISDAIGNAKTWLKTKGLDILIGLKTGMDEKWTDIKTWFGNIPTNVKSALGDLTKTLWNAGSNLLGGLLAGMKDKFEDAKNFVLGIGKWISDHKGPKSYDLKLLTPHGGWIMSGLQAGIVNGLDGVLRTVDGVAGSILDAASGAGSLAVQSLGTDAGLAARGASTTGTGATIAAGAGSNVTQTSFYGDLSFPNITSPDDAAKFLENLSDLAGNGGTK